ncbi:MAG TPA: amidohydrolase family protein [Pyrinomonadaceae bacterium]|jgi:aminocarboxymuconate-semialdehyde decarboxylase|nr:amidohydrolase family protein [Pyrinomonadaceae bacterium]
MLKIDVHTHILPKEIPNWKGKFGYGGFIQLEHQSPGCARMLRDDGHAFRDVVQNCWSPEQRIEEIDAQGVNVQVLSTVPVMFSYWAKPRDGADIAMFLNDGIAENVNDFPLRFIGLGTVPMQNTSLAIKELERCNRIGLVGVQIGTNVNQQNLGEPQFFDFFKACEELGMAVFVHPWEMMGEADMQKYWLPWLVGMPAEVSRAICSLIFSGTLEKLPELRICFAHGGGSFPATLGRIDHGFTVRPDLCAVDNPHSPRKYLGRMYFDSLVHEAAKLDYLLKLVGADQIALGSDYPFPLGELEPGKLIESMPYDDEIKAMLLHGSALNWLNLDKGKFQNE